MKMEFNSSSSVSTELVDENSNNGDDGDDDDDGHDVEATSFRCYPYSRFILTSRELWWNYDR